MWCGSEGAAGLERVDVVQPVLWAVMVSLARLWESVGVVPDAVVGHSQGEIAAACVAGALIAGGCRAGGGVAQSGDWRQLSGAGGMVSVGCGVQHAHELVAEWGDRLSMAAVNGVSAVVVSGEVAALEQVMRRGMR